MQQEGEGKRLFDGGQKEMKELLKANVKFIFCREARNLNPGLKIAYFVVYDKNEG